MGRWGDRPSVELGAFLLILVAGFLILMGYEDGASEDSDHGDGILPSEYSPQHREIVPQKTLDTIHFLGYSNYRGLVMANVLNTDKQIAIIGQLAEGSSIRSIERITGIHRDTIMRLGVKIGQGCTSLMDAQMRNLPCDRLELDEIWGFIGKKDRQVRRGDSMEVGSVWTWCAIDADTKLVPAFKVGERNTATANAFVQDVANRMAKRVQISTDGLSAYREAIEKSFGADVDFAQIIKTYGHEETTDNRRYSAPEFVSSEKKIVTGRPNVDLISTSYVERLNATTRLHMRRLTRLTLAFSKKRENFEAAVGLHFAYYNFVKRHNTLRCTPAMAAGVTPSFWSVGDLLEATA
jgi:IS1 family transposase